MRKKKRRNFKAMLRCPSTLEEMMEYLNLKTLAANYASLVESAGKDNIS